MNTFKATITSKGQITLPKPIRDVLTLVTGDQVVFTVKPNNQVIMEKEEFSVKYQTKINFLSLLLEHGLPIVVKGVSGVGKTTFVKHFLLKQFNHKKVAVIQLFDEGYNE